MSPLYPKLRPGPGLAADLVIAHQRARLRGAMIELSAERGYSGVTVRGLTRLAGVSTKTFYDCFENVGDCFSATYLWVVRNVLHRALTADGEDEKDRLRARVAAIFGFLAKNPKAARLVLVEAVAARSFVDDQARGSAVAFERLLAEELFGGSAGAPSRSMVPHAAIGAGIRVARTCLLSGPRGRTLAAADAFADWLWALRGASLGDAARLPESGPDREPERRPAPAAVGNERRLLLTAAVRVALRDGYGALTAPVIRREAGVSRRAFEENFGGSADCFLAAVESKISEACGRAERAAKAAGSWEHRVVRALQCLCVELAREPAIARLALVDIFAPGPPGLERREDIVKRLAGRLRRAAPPGAHLGRVAAEASVAGAWRIAKLHIVDGPAGPPGELAGAMALVILVPALGAPAAERAILAGDRAAG